MSDIQPESHMTWYDQLAVGSVATIALLIFVGVLLWAADTWRKR